MSNNKLFKVPFGFYCENNKLISKRTQIEKLLDGINNDAEANAQLDVEQGKQIAANTEAINKEVERSSNVDEQFIVDLENEIADRKRMGSIINNKIGDLEVSLKSLVEETDKAFDVVADELIKKDEELSASISILKNQLENESTSRKNADEALSEAIRVNLSEIEEVEKAIDELSTNIEKQISDVNSRIDINKGEISRIDGSLTEEVSNRIDSDDLLNEKIGKVATSLREVYSYAKAKDEELYNAILSEQNRAIEAENRKVEFTQLGGGRKGIVLENNDLILGKDSKGNSANIAMLSKWDVVDLGSSSLKINLNTPNGVRPTVQEAGQSGEQAHKIAYLSDVENINNTLQKEIKEEEKRALVSEKELSDLIRNEESRAISVENRLEEKLDSSVISLNSTINNMNSTLGILSTTDTALNSRMDVISSSFNNFKTNGIELQPISELQYALYVDGVIKGTIDIPKDNFLTNVYLTNENKLHFVFSVNNKQTDIEVDIAKYIDIYTAGKGLKVESNKFSIVIDSNSEGYLTVSDNGVKLHGIEDSINLKVKEETDRAFNVEQNIINDLSSEIERAKNAEKVLENNIKNEENRALSVEKEIFDRVIKVEGFELDIVNNRDNIQVLKNELLSEKNRALSAEKVLSEDITTLTTKVSDNEGKISLLSVSLDNEVSIRESKEEELFAKIDNNTIKINSEIERAKNAENTNKLEINNLNDKKVDWVSLGNDRKSIVLRNNDLILGTASDNIKTYNIAMISKWDVVDLGTTSLPINLNTPSGVRPTVQEAGQSGEQAHKIAYLSDVENTKQYVDERFSELIIPSVEGLASEEWVESKGYLTEHQSLTDYALKSDIPSVEGLASEEWVESKGYLTEHQSLTDYALKSDIPSVEGLASEEWVESKGYLTEHQSLTDYALKSELEEIKQLILNLQERIKELESKILSSTDLINIVSKIKEGETLNIKLFSDITLDEENKLQIPQNSIINLDMNGKTINGNFNDILFRVNGILNISGNGSFKGEAYVASVNKGGIINVFNGNFENEVTTFQANGGVINIEDGYFANYSEVYGAKYTLNHVDAQKEIGLISVKGGTFINYNPKESYSENPPMNFLEEGYTIYETKEDNKTIYKVIPIIDVETPNNLTNIISNLKDGENAYIKLVNDVELDGTLPMFINKGTKVILDLNNKTFTNKVAGRAAIINDGEMIIKNGSIVNGNNTKQGGASILNRSNMIIENGNFGSKEQRGAAVENKGNLIINGGTFSSLEKGKDNSNGWAYVFINRGEDNPLMTINNANVNGNVHGVFCAESGVVNVNGGMYTMGDETLSTYYMCYVIDGTINLNGGTFNWHKGLTSRTPIYKDGQGEINVNEGSIVNW